MHELLQPMKEFPNESLNPCKISSLLKKLMDQIKDESFEKDLEKHLNKTQEEFLEKFLKKYMEEMHSQRILGGIIGKNYFLNQTRIYFRWKFQELFWLVLKDSLKKFLAVSLEVIVEKRYCEFKVNWLHLLI